MTSRDHLGGRGLLENNLAERRQHLTQLLDHTEDIVSLRHESVCFSELLVDALPLEKNPPDILGEVENLLGAEGVSPARHIVPAFSDDRHDRLDGELV